MEVENEATKSTADRLWDVATKLMVPLGFIVAAALVNHEIRLEVHDEKLSHMAPDWLRDDMNELKETLGDMQSQQQQILQRLVVLENGK